MAMLIRAFLIEEINGWDETALYDHLYANPSLRRELGFETLPNQSTFWRAWNHRFSDEADTDEYRFRVDGEELATSRRRWPPGSRVSSSVPTRLGTELLARRMRWSNALSTNPENSVVIRVSHLVVGDERVGVMVGDDPLALPSFGGSEHEFDIEVLECHREMHPIETPIEIHAVGLAPEN